jgi:gluconate 2-dehydrogenase gamma chain
MADKGLSRRRLLTVGAIVGAAPLAPAAADTFQHAPHMPWEPNAAASPDIPKGGDDFLFFSGDEQAFVKAAVARMIPKDDLGPGAVEAGVPIFIDRQLASDFGKASDWYMQGPWAKGEKTQGYQSRMTPAQMYRAAIKAIDEATNQASKKSFANLAAADQDAFLKKLEKGDVALSGGVDAKGFFTLFLQNVMEGFFADPLYGGNRGMAGWKLIGFSGARYDQRAYVKTYGQPYPLPPVGIMGRPDWGKS